MDLAELTRGLLAEWCDGMLSHQIDDPGDAIRHGALACPSCELIHGRCWEAVYPLLHMAKATGEKKYLDAGLRLVEWSKNVTRANGAWSNDFDPTSWQGTTIFGAIALAEAIYHHGNLLSQEQQSAWKSRLGEAAGGYLWSDFTRLDVSNVNYGFSAVYGFDLIGRVMGEARYIDRSRALALGVQDYFTLQNSLIFGEGKPVDNRSARGLLPVDLGYNVEESLNGVVLYALETRDEKLLALLQRSMERHLEFMLPDGAWDNSWGTRQYKWTYWGSRTSDGCLPAFAMMTGRNPAFGTAAYRNTELLSRCTSEGLLHGGPHYVSHGVKPCIHHTFAHAKVLAFFQDNLLSLPAITPSAPLPRVLADGVTYFPEIEVWLAARGPWRATISAYDSVYRTPEHLDHVLQATGGSLAILHHDRVGPIFAASMAQYLRVEPRNQQVSPGDDFPLTPRVERRLGGKWHTNLYDLKAQVAYRDNDATISFDVAATLQDADHCAEEGARYDLRYDFGVETVTIGVRLTAGKVIPDLTRLILPLISPSAEVVRQISDNRIELIKAGGTVVIEATVPLSIGKTEGGRMFNLVPGCEAVPIVARLDQPAGIEMVCTVSVVR